MDIAPGVSAADWRGLQLDDEAHEDWQTAVSILRQRLWKRYIEPIDILIAAESSDPRQRTAGFTVLAVDCLLLEAYASFRLGLVHTSGRSKRVFTTFLTARPRFRRFFNRGRATKFYSDFRCGVLHQAEVAADCRIWSVGSLWREDNGITYVNRTALHSTLKDDLEEYMTELSTRQGGLLRRNFRTKMDHIAAAAPR